MTFTDEPLHEIVEHLRARLEPPTLLTFTVLNPDLHPGLFSGERVELNGVTYRHRPYKTWLDLAERLNCRFLSPLVDDPHITLRFQPLDLQAPWREAEGTEKYSPDSPFGRVSKLEEPAFLLDYEEALVRAALPPGGTVLDLGVNTGDEFAPFGRLYPPDVCRSLRFVGVDHSESAVARAKERFPGSRFSFYIADVNELAGLELPRFDLVISIGTLQSPGVRDRELLRSLVQHHLTERGALILGFPNSRYVDGEIVYGARMKNFRQAELSLLVKDLAFYKKYLQQHKFKVFVTGKYDLLITAVRAEGEA